MPSTCDGSKKNLKTSSWARMLKRVFKTGVAKHARRDFIFRSVAGVTYLDYIRNYLTHVAVKKEVKMKVRI